MLFYVCPFTYVIEKKLVYKLCLGERTVEKGVERANHGAMVNHHPLGEPYSSLI